MSLRFDPDEVPGAVPPESVSPLVERKAMWNARELSVEYRQVMAKRIAGDPEYVGWRTGFYSLDKEMRYRPGEFWIIAAATSVGKSALMQSMQRRCPVPSVTFSLEMSRTQMLDRLFAAEAEVDAWKLSTGALRSDDILRVEDAIKRFESTDIQIADDPSLTTSSIETILRIAPWIRVVYVDYAGLLLDRDGESRYVQMSNVSHALKRTALSANVCIVAASQVNRKGDRKSGEPPFIDEIRDSGVVGEDADVILALGRAEGASEAKLAVRKARNALAGYSIPLTFDAVHAQFLEPSEARREKPEPREVREELPF